MDQPQEVQCERTEVIICGAGPTGALLSAMLGQMRVPNVVLEREADITTDPRGIALDEDGIRMLQAIGMYDRVYTDIGSCMTRFNFVTGKGKDLKKPPLLSINNSTTEGGTGHPGFITHKQPQLEKAIRDAISLCPFSELRSQCTVNGIQEDESQVYVDYTDGNGQHRELRAPFLVGADGKTGFVRKKYLEPKGIIMERCEGTNYDETWVALNWHINLPTEKTHPTFPLWALGYTPEQVYDLFFPEEFRFLCNPYRPSVCGRFGPPADRLWRFEFVVREGEDGHHMASHEECSKIIYPYLTHPGKRYGLSSPITYPDDCITTLRSRPFSFSARSCNRWAEGRVIVAGDAAHVFPPFGGQGIASGFRDASGLAWRLALLHRESRADHKKVLTAWYTERKQQLERSLAATIQNGEYVTASDPLKIFVREWYLWAVQLIPSWKRGLEKGPRAEGMARYQHRDGLPFLPDYGGGLLLPQVYAARLVDQKVFFTDDLIFNKSKTGLFQLLLLPRSQEEAASLLTDAQNVTELSNGYVRTDEVTIVIQDTTTPSRCCESDPSLHNSDKIARLATGEEFAIDPVLCKGRPAPKYYDPLRMMKGVGGKPFVIVRPDRFVYAACSTLAELHDALQRIPEALQLRDV